MPHYPFGRKKKKFMKFLRKFPFVRYYSTAVPKAAINLRHFHYHITYVRKQWKILYNLVINDCEFYAFDRHCLFNKKQK